MLLCNCQKHKQEPIKKGVKFRYYAEVISWFISKTLANMFTCSYYSHKERIRTKKTSAVGDWLKKAMVHDLKADIKKTKDNWRGLRKRGSDKRLFTDLTELINHWCRRKIMYLFRQKCIVVKLIRKGSIYCTEHFHCTVYCL